MSAIASCLQNRFRRACPKRRNRLAVFDHPAPLMGGQKGENGGGAKPPPLHGNLRRGVRKRKRLPGRRLFERYHGDAVFALAVAAEAKFAHCGMLFQVLLDAGAQNAGTLAVDNIYLL